MILIKFMNRGNQILQGLIKGLDTHFSRGLELDLDLVTHLEAWHPHLRPLTIFVIADASWSHTSTPCVHLREVRERTFK